MATITWNGANADWSDAVDWSTGTVPGSDDEANISSGTVTVSTAINVGSIDTEGQAILFFDTAGISDQVNSDITNDAVVEVDSSSAATSHLTVAGDFENGGYLEVGDTKSVGAADVTIDGTLTNDTIVEVGGFGSTSVSASLVVGHLVEEVNVKIYVGGGYGAAAGEEASLIDLGDAAPTTLSAGLYVTGNGLVEWKSGEIETLDAPLSLGGANARVAVAGETSTSSALDELQANNDTLTVCGGAKLDITAGAFTNNSQIFLTEGGIFSTEAGVGFDNVGQITVGNGLLPNGASPDDKAAQLVVDGSITNESAGGIFIDGQYGGSLTVAGTLTNNGNISLGDLGSSVSATVDHLVNTGSIFLGGDTTGTATASVFKVLDDNAPDALAAGVFLSLSGDSLLQFAGGEIGSVSSGATLALTGPDARIADAGSTHTNSALTSLANNAGTILVSNGAKMTNASVAFDNSGTYSISTSQPATEGSATVVKTDGGVGFDNSGTLNVDQYAGATGPAYGGSTFSVGGVLTNSGTLNIGNIKLAQDTLVEAGKFANTGAVNITGDYATGTTEYGASLIVLHSQAPSDLAAGVSINLIGNALLEFASGGVKEIEEGAQLTLDSQVAHLADKSDASSNSALDGLAHNLGTLTLENGAAVSTAPAAFSNSGTINIESGNNATVETSLTVNSQFTNTGTLSLSNSSFSDNATVELNASSIDNSGTIGITINNGEQGAQLDSAGAITNTGTIEVTDTGTYADEASISITADGKYIQQSGESNFDEPNVTLSASEIDVKGGTLIVGGEIDGNTVVSGGLLEVGPPANGDQLTLDGNLSMDAKGNLGVTIDGTESFDGSTIAVEGAARLNGVLEISIQNSQDLTAGEQFDVVSYTSHTGKFSALEYDGTEGSSNYVNIGNGLALQASYLGTGVELTVVDATSGTASPAIDIDSGSLGSLASLDHFQFDRDVQSALGHVDELLAGSASKFSAIHELAQNLQSNEALLFAQTSGAHADVTYLVIDPNGVTGYHAGETMIVALTSQEASAFGHIG